MVGHIEVRTSMSDELIEFDKRSRIHQKLDSLACREFSSRMLFCDSFFAAAGLGSYLRRQPQA
jgi:hypothetical protein